MGKMHNAKINNEPAVVIWGTGSPRRDCLYVDDLADACIFLMENYDESEMINVGSGEDISILELAQSISDTIGFKGDIVFDKSKPNGTLRKLLDTSKINKMGWSPKISFKNGSTQTYQWYKDHCI